MTCALMSTSPSSNTANRPTGPAPMMMASVSMVAAAAVGAPLRLQLMDRVPFSSTLGWGQTPCRDSKSGMRSFAQGGLPHSSLLLLAGRWPERIMSHRAIGIAGVGKHLLGVLGGLAPIGGGRCGAARPRLRTAHDREHLLQVVGDGGAIGAGLRQALAGLNGALARLLLRRPPHHRRGGLAVGIDGRPAAAARGPAASRRSSPRQRRTAPRNGVPQCLQDRPPRQPLSCCARGRRISWRRRGGPAGRLRPTSELLLGHADDEAVEGVRDLDLAAEAARGAHVEGEVEHVLLHLRGAPVFSRQASST